MSHSPTDHLENFCPAFVGRWTSLGCPGSAFLDVLVVLLVLLSPDSSILSVLVLLLLTAKVTVNSSGE